MDFFFKNVLFVHFFIPSVSIFDEIAIFDELLSLD